MKTNKIMKPALALVAAMALTTIGAATANAAVVSNKFYEFSEVRFNSCTGEFVDLSGKIHIHGTSTATPDGGFSFSFIENLVDVKGVGEDSGTRYVETLHLGNTVSLHAGVTETHEILENLISNGSSSNYKLRVRFHITVNANGDVTVENEHVEIICNP